MECSSVKCVKPDNDRTVSCWLCLNFYHLKCSGSALRARDADALADPQKFLHWTCSSCKSVGVEFYKFFKSFKDEFEKINTEFQSLQSKFNNFGKLFSEYKKLDEHVTYPPKSLAKRKMKNVVNAESQDNFQNGQLTVNTGHDSASPLQSPLSSPGTSLTSVNTGFALPSIVIGATGGANSPTGATGSANSPTANVIDPSCSVDNRYNSATSFTPVVLTDSIQPDPKPLRAVPPNKSIFVSRLALDTSIEDVEHFIKSKCGEDAVISTYKFVYSQPRSISSFKITVVSDVFKNIVDSSFWPVNTFVREYIVRERRGKVARLSEQASSSSKNCLN